MYNHRSMSDYQAQNEKEALLADAILKIKTRQEALNFLRDLLTPVELEEFAKRIEIAKFLYDKKMSYQEIADKLSVSTTTVTRVAQWLRRGCGGYESVLQRLQA